jgi:hypothetical protein
MSLSLTLSETIDKVIQTFITKVAIKYNLKDSELNELWSGKTSSTPSSTPSLNEEKTVVDNSTLLKCTKAELSALCKTHGHKCSGTKAELISRLLGVSFTETDTKKTTNKKAVPDVKTTTVVKKLTANIPKILIRRNSHNNYEHPESGLVFDNSSQTVIGKQNDNGTVDDLTEEDIDKCNAFKFKFKLPKNLDKKSNLVNVEVDDLDDDDDDDGVEIEEEEELLEEDDLLGDDEEYEEYTDDE